MTDPVKTDPISADLAPFVRYLQEEGHRLRLALKEQTDATVKSVRADARKRIDDISAAGHADFAAIRNEIESSVVGTATTETKAIVLKKTGEAVEEIMTLCRTSLQKLAQREGFESIMAALVAEAAQCAGEMSQTDANDTSLGDILVAPRDAGPCRKIVAEQNLDLTVKEDSSIEDGVEIVVAGTPYRIRNTFSSRMEKLEPRMRELATMRLRSALSGGSTE